MDADHAYLDKLLAAFLSAEDDSEVAADLFFQFSQHIRLHIELENEFLFPRFEKYLHFSGGVGPTAKLYRDHDNILKLLDEVELVLQSGRENNIRDAKKHLHRFLDEHRRRENETQYPVCDTFVSEKELEKAIIDVFGFNPY